MLPALSHLVRQRLAIEVFEVGPQGGHLPARVPVQDVLDGALAVREQGGHARAGPDAARVEHEVAEPLRVQPVGRVGQIDADDPGQPFAAQRVALHAAGGVQQQPSGLGQAGRVPKNLAFGGRWPPVCRGQRRGQRGDSGSGEARHAGQHVGPHVAGAGQDASATPG